MNEKLLEQKAEEYAIKSICEACNQCQSKGYIGCDKYRVGKQAYIAGATEETKLIIKYMTEGEQFLGDEK